MTPHAAGPNTTRIGLFALGGLALLVAAIVAIFGSGLFAQQEQAVLHFRGSVYGLQVGSPVVFRGVRLGGVKSVGVVYGEGRFSVPVVVQLDRHRIRTLSGAANTDAALSLPALIDKGLSAQLATHSLLTGQLYIDLDLRPGTKLQTVAGGSAVTAPAASATGLIEIPTTITRFQSLQDQLDRVDLTAMTADLAATLAAARALVAGPEVKATLADMARASSTLATLATSLEQKVAPLAAAAQGTLGQAGQASQRVATAAERTADRVGERVALAADGIASAAARADALLAPGSPVLGSVQKAADELARSALALRSATSEDAPTVLQVQRAVGDVSRAARALRELAEQLQQQPQQLLRGRADAP
jgi:paraquat-inducible protein B